MCVSACISMYSLHFSIFQSDPSAVSEVFDKVETRAQEGEADRGDAQAGGREATAVVDAVP